ncbi:hypothetical protein HDV06_000243 [Boothiomyces sp. JEL0866]|nr:hypothetical protein HDV06_000243 [Boothiomyces sp. JEL0866]
MTRKRLPKSHSNPIPEVKNETLKRSNSDSIAFIPTNLQKCLVKDLKEYCTILNLDVHGKKQDLIEKISNERIRLLDQGLDAGQETQNSNLERESSESGNPAQEVVIRGQRGRRLIVKKEADVERVLKDSLDSGQAHSGQQSLSSQPAQRIKGEIKGRNPDQTKNSTGIDETLPKSARVTKRKGKRAKAKKDKSALKVQEEIVCDNAENNIDHEKQDLPGNAVESAPQDSSYKDSVGDSTKDTSLSGIYDFKSKMNDLKDPDDSFGIGIQSTIEYRSIYPSLNEALPVDPPATTLQTVGSAIHKSIIDTQKSSLIAAESNSIQSLDTSNNLPNREIPSKNLHLKESLENFANNSSEQCREIFYCAVCKNDINFENIGGKAVIQYLSVYLQDNSGKTTKLVLESNLPESKKDETSICQDCVVRNENAIDKVDITSEISLTVDDYLPQKENDLGRTSISPKIGEESLDDHGGLNLAYADDFQDSKETVASVPVRPSKKRPYKAYSPTEVNAAIRNSPVTNSLPPTKKFKSSIPYPAVSPSPMKKAMAFKKPTKFSAILQSPLRQNIPKYKPKENEKVKERLDHLLNKVVPGSKEEWDLAHQSSPRIPRE